MKVLFVVFARDSNVGGGARIAFEMANMLSEKGVEVAMLLPGNSTESFKKNNITYITIKSLEIRTTISKLSIATIKKVTKFIDDFNPDLIHSHTLSYIGLLGQYWAKKNNKPFIFTTHEIPSKIFDFLEKRGVLKSKIGLSIVQSFSKYFILNSDAIIALTDYVKLDLINLGFKNKIEVIPNGRNLEMFNKLKYPSIFSKEKNLIFTGVISKRKNQIFLIKVLKLLPSNFNLYLAGDDIEKSYKENIRKIIAKNKDIESRVHFLGRVDFEKISEYLQNSHIFVSASKHEVFSLSIIEALAAGKPIVMLSEASTNSWITKDAYIVNSNEEEFAERILQIANLNNAQYNNLCNKMRDFSKQYELSSIVDKTVNFYNNFLLEFSNKRNNKIEKSGVMNILKFISKSSVKEKELKNNRKNFNLPKIGKQEAIIASFMLGSLVLYSGVKYINQIKNLKGKLSSKDS